MATSLQWTPGKVALYYNPAWPSKSGTEHILAARHPDGRFWWPLRPTPQGPWTPASAYGKGHDHWLDHCVWVGTLDAFHVMRKLAVTPEDLVAIVERLAPADPTETDRAILDFCEECGISADSVAEARAHVIDAIDGDRECARLRDLLTQAEDIAADRKVELARAKNLAASLRTAIDTKAHELLALAANAQRTPPPPMVENTDTLTRAELEDHYDALVAWVGAEV